MRVIRAAELSLRNGGRGEFYAVFTAIKKNSETPEPEEWALVPLGGGLRSRTEAARPPRPAPAGRRRRGRRSSITGAQARGPEGGSSRPVPLLPPPIPLQQPSQNPPTPPGTFRRMARPAGWGGLGAGRGAGVSRCLPSTRCGPGTADSLAPSTGWTRAWKSSEGPGGQTLTGTGRGL